MEKIQFVVGEKTLNDGLYLPNIGIMVMHSPLRDALGLDHFTIP